MTCIVGLVDGGRVWMGGDSAGVAGWDLKVRADRKVFRNGPYVMGFTTSFRMGQLLRHGFAPPAPVADLDEFMATTFIDAVRERLKAGGWASKENEREEGGAFLVGTRGRLFEIGSDYQVGENVDGWGAVGCGDQVAHGALYASRGKVAMDRVVIALSAAERFSAGVRRPFAVRVA
jgi:hypothetical protein